MKIKRKKLDIKPPAARDIAIVPNVDPNNGIAGPDRISLILLVIVNLMIQQESCYTG